MICFSSRPISPTPPYPYVVYFNQCLGAAHSKCWCKYAFFIFCRKNVKMKKNKEKQAKMRQKRVNCLHPNAGRGLYSHAIIHVVPFERNFDSHYCNTKALS